MDLKKNIEQNMESKIMKRKYLILLIVLILLGVIIFLGYNIYNYISYVPRIDSYEESGKLLFLFGGRASHQVVDGTPS